MMAKVGDLARIRAEKAPLDAEEEARRDAEKKQRIAVDAAYGTGYEDGVAYAREHADLSVFQARAEEEVDRWYWSSPSLAPILATDLYHWLKELKGGETPGAEMAYRRGWLDGFDAVWEVIKAELGPSPGHGSDFASMPPAPDAEQGGYVYLLVNLSMPDLVKIGQTTRDPRTRAQELGSVPGVPTPFTLVFDVQVGDPPAAEQYVHSRFAGMRVSRGREFFRVSPSEAVRVLLEAEKRYPLTKLTDRSGLGD
jgi:hypothetical protein